MNLRLHRLRLAYLRYTASRLRVPLYLCLKNPISRLSYRRSICRYHMGVAYDYFKTL